MYFKKTYLILILFLSISIFSQQKEYSNATFYLKENQLEEATFQIQKAIRKVKNNKSKYYLLYATILKNKNIVDSSLYYYNKVENDYTKRKIKDSLLLVLASKLEFYRFHDKKKDADYYIERINQFQLNQIKNKDIVAYALNRKLSVFNQYHYSNKDTLVLIDKIGKEILDLKSDIKNKEVIAYTLNEIAQIEDYRGDKNKAFSKYEEALKYAKDNELLGPQIDISFNLAALYSRFKNNNKKALEVLEKLVSKVEERANLSQKYRFFLQIKDYYKFTNRLEEAFLAFDKAYQYSQEFNEQQSYFKLTALERKYEFEKKEKKIQESENEIKIQKLEIENSTKKFWLVFIIFLLTTIGVITLTFFFRREKKMNKELRMLSSENEFLMAEANHRINNNLQLIIILINEELKKASQENNFQIKKILTKVDAIATLHRHLYRSEDKKAVEIASFLKDIQVSFFEMFSEKNIKFDSEIESFKVPIDIAMYIGILVTELSINSLKHAFTTETNKVIKLIINKKNSKLYFKYQDNGKGISTNTKLKLIDKLCRQLKIEYTVTNNNGFSLEFNKEL